MISSGGMRPPLPTTPGPGSAFPLESTSTSGAVISVCVRLLPVAPPGRNSVTNPPTSTASPTATASAAAVPKTNMPSEVAKLESGLRSSKKNPFETFAVTMPGTLETACPSRGERCAAPWMSWIRAGGPTVVNDQTALPVIVSGGSSTSLSETCAPTIVTVHVSSWTKSALGFRVKDSGPPPAAAVCAPLVVQEMENHDPLTVTGSLKFTVMFASTATPVAPAAGVVEETCGAASVETMCAPRPVKSSVAKPSHSTAGSNASPGSGSPASIAALRRSVLSAVLVRPVPHSVPGSNPRWPMESITVAPLRSSTASSPLNQPEPFVWSAWARITGLAVLCATT